MAIVVKIFLYVFLLLFLMGFSQLLCVLLYDLYLLMKRPLKKFYQQRSSETDYCSYDQIPARFLQFIVKNEDRNFFKHSGFAWSTIRKAFLFDLRSRKLVRGGSSISQQLIKNLYFRFEKRIFRKLCEFFLTLHAERVLGKRRILELYLNVIYFGCGKYGIMDAARFYFDKYPNELTVNQMFLLSSLLPAPTAGNPLKHPDGYRRICDMRIKLLIERKALSEEEAKYIRMMYEGEIDPELRTPDPEELSRYNKAVMYNERFGLPARRRKTAIVKSN